MAARPVAVAVDGSEESLAGSQVRLHGMVGIGSDGHPAMIKSRVRTRPLTTWRSRWVIPQPILR
jgi:hypothetical protein